MRTAVKRNSGFTLPEVIVASTLLLLALVPILKAMAQINANTVLIERRTKSLSLAKMKINELQAKSIYNFNDVISENNQSLDDSYLCNISSQTINTNLKAITVSVGMDKNQNGSLAANEIEISLKTQLARR
ncbi:MAG: prepilin-type N-terminal cleavage/methylation domain-containing protein [Phycisphaerales bacterium]